MTTPGLVDAANRQLFRAGSALLPGLSPGSVRGWAALLGETAATAQPRLANGHIEQWRHNVARLLHREPTDAELRAGLRSWVRMYLETLALPGWSADTLRRLVHAEPAGLARLRAAHAGAGAVIALPHVANWDLAGAWACVSDLPVTTVAERLGPREFANYQRLRGHLGLEVFAHDDRGAIAGLIRAVRGGRVVCLMADRDLTGAGLPVDFAGQQVTMPAGPALVARRTGAALIPMVPHYTADQMVLEFGPDIHPGPGREGLSAATQQVADHFVAQLRAHPVDWQVMQPFFDRTPVDKAPVDRAPVDKAPVDKAPVDRAP